MISLIFLIAAIVTIIINFFYWNMAILSWALFFYALAYAAKNIEKYKEKKKYLKDLSITIRYYQAAILCYANTCTEIELLDISEENMAQIQLIIDRNVEEYQNECKQAIDEANKSSRA